MSVKLVAHGRLTSKDAPRSKITFISLYVNFTYIEHTCTIERMIRFTVVCKYI